MPSAIHGKPNANPRTAAWRRVGDAPCAVSKITTPTNASGQNPHGGSEKATSVPPSAAANTRRQPCRQLGRAAGASDSG